MLNSKINVNIPSTLKQDLKLTQQLGFNLDKTKEHNVFDTYSIVIPELTQAFTRELLKEISSQSEDFLDVRGYNFEANPNLCQKAFHDLCFYMKGQGFDFMIMPVKYGMFIQDQIDFICVATTHDLKTHQLINPIGSYQGIDCYTNSWEKWNSKIILCGRKDSLFYNYQIVEKIQEHGLAEVINYTLLYTIKSAPDSFVKLHFVDEENYPEYIQWNRDKKIDEII